MTVDNGSVLRSMISVELKRLNLRVGEESRCDGKVYRFARRTSLLLSCQLTT